MTIKKRLKPNFVV